MDDRKDAGQVDDGHRRPPGVSDDEMKALGLPSKALETVEQARGHLYAVVRSRRPAW